MPDDETVNQMIARHEEEFDLFMVSWRRNGGGGGGEGAVMATTGGGGICMAPGGSSCPGERQNGAACPW